MRLEPRSRLVVAGAFVVVLMGCSSNDETTPSAPTVAATPTPAPTPTPTPSPTTGCNLQAMDDCGRSGCCRQGGAPLFDGEIAAAQEALRTSNPELFNRNGSLRVDEVEYTDALARKITQMFALCARGGGGGTSISRDEVAVKRDNGVSQNYDVILGANNTPYVGGNYTCRPASF